MTELTQVFVFVDPPREWAEQWIAKIRETAGVEVEWTIRDGRVSLLTGHPVAVAAAIQEHLPELQAWRGTDPRNGNSYRAGWHWTLEVLEILREHRNDSRR